MLRVAIFYCFAECLFPDQHYAECHFAERHFAECHYAECHFAECHYAEYRGALLSTDTKSPTKVKWVIPASKEELGIWLEGNESSDELSESSILLSCKRKKKYLSEIS